MQKPSLFALFAALGAASGCSSRMGQVEAGGKEGAVSFDRIVEAVGKQDAIVFEGEGGSKVLVSPRYQGRIMTTRVGKVESVGFVSTDEIAEGEVHESFNNFGGQDRFWLGPEAGQFGIYFPAGVELKRDLWKVPPDFNRGPFTVVEKTPRKARFAREMSVTNYTGTRFKAKVEREVGLIPSERLKDELKVALPRGVSYAGSYSDNSLANAGDRRWDKETGLINIWILGQFAPGSRAVIIAPFKPGDGPAYRDEMYFGKVPADRLKLLGNAVLFRADARKEGKFGMPQARTSGVAGSFDFEKNLLVVVKFDVPTDPALYGNSAWVKVQPDPYSGDLFQTYNSDASSGKPPGRYAFFELESVSPSRELAPGESVRHRQATFCFQGDYQALNGLAREVLGVDLDDVKKAMF